MMVNLRLMAGAGLHWPDSLGVSAVTFRRLTIAALALCTIATPALAGHGHPAPAYPAGAAAGPVYYPPMMGAPWPTTVMAQPVQGYPQGYPQSYPQGYPAPDPRWQEMNDRCAKVYGDKGVGGALIGGALGGIVGNRVAKGDRLLGTVVGGVAGAVAGTVIDKAEDRSLRRECDDYFASVQQGGYPAGGYPGYGYPGAPYGYVMVPVMIQPQQPCVETTVVTEKWVDVPVRRRAAPRRAPVVREKRVKEKRVYTG